MSQQPTPREREALYEIMRQASWLPLHSEHRKTIEDAASVRLRVPVVSEAPQ